MKLVIDTDAGIDDAVALLMALAAPNVEVTAITTVVGNVPLAQATHNTGVILNAANAPAIPLYQGCAYPLLQQPAINAIDVHGTDGLGGAAAGQPSRPTLEPHASLALIELARQHPGQLTLLTLGPLTNVALAIRLYPEFLQTLRNIVIMGGSVEGRGNTTPSAEFNVMVDPEAAAIVFDTCRQAGLLATLVTWEATLAHAVPLNVWAQMIAGSGPVARLLQQMTDYLAGRWGPVDILWPDPLAAAVAFDPGVVLAQSERFVAVETGSGLTRGQTVVDYRPHSRQPANIKLVDQVDPQKFQALLQLAAHPEAE